MVDPGARVEIMGHQGTVIETMAQMARVQMDDGRRMRVNRALLRELPAPAFPAEPVPVAKALHGPPADKSLKGVYSYRST